MDKHKHCKNLLEGLSAYIDDEASESICRQIEQHLEDCDNCRVMLDTLKKTISLYQATDSAELMPETVRERLLQTLHLEDMLSDSAADPSVEA